MTNTLRSQYVVLKFLAVRLHALDERRHPIPRAVATGFVIPTDQGLRLVTCWHVVTGFNMHDIRVGLELPKRRYLELTFLDTFNKEAGAQTFSGFRKASIPLYGRDLPPMRPLWLQNDAHVPSPDLNQVGLFVPSFHDIVFLPLPPEIEISFIQIVDAKYRAQWRDDALPGERCLIVGFPFGYGAHTEQLAPIVLTRFVASDTVPGRYDEFFIDSIAAPGMSGAPVFLERDGKLALIGVYTGAIYPEQAAAIDQQVSAPRRDSHEGRSWVTDLGTVVDIARLLTGYYPMTTNPSRAHVPPNLARSPADE